MIQLWLALGLLVLSTLGVTYAPMKPILAKVIAFRKLHPTQQFGQASNDAVWYGSTACTHAWWQFAIWVWTGIFLTLNQINSLAGMPYKAKTAGGAPRGMNSNEAAALIVNFNARYGAGRLPYKIVFDYTFEELLNYSNRGPAMYAVDYGVSPTWKGYIYNGILAKLPFAFLAGKTQLGASFRHAVGLLGYLRVTSQTNTYHEWKYDPNHGSSARPEKPPFEIITTGQGQAEYNRYASHWGIRLYAAIPLKSLPV